jgi:hypothetical protein
MKQFTYEQIVQALEQIEATLNEISKDANKRPLLKAKLTIYRQSTLRLKNLYIRFVEAKNKAKK